MNNKNIARMDLNLLVLFTTLVETRSVTSTASRLHLSQPAVSHALARLREALGDRLFVPTRSGLVLTPRAEELAGPTRSALESLEALLSPEGFSPSTTDRTFRIASSDYGAMVVVPEFADRFFETAPNARLDILHFTSDTGRDLETGMADVALYGNEPPKGRFRSIELFREHFSCLVRRGHPLMSKARSGSITLKEYSKWSHALVSVHGGPTGIIDDRLAELGRKRTIEFMTPFFLTAPMVVSRSDLILTAPSRLAERLKTLLRLARLELPFNVADYGYFLVWHERAEDDPNNRWFRQMIISTLKRPKTTLRNSKRGTHAA